MYRELYRLAVVIDIWHDRTLGHFLMNQNIHSAQQFETRMIMGMRKLLQVDPNWRDTYLKYGGIEAVLLRQGEMVVASGFLSYAIWDGYGYGWLDTPKNGAIPSRFRFECRDVRKEGLYCHPMHQYVAWDRDLYKIKPI